MQFDNAVVVISGAASGIGQALCKQIATRYACCIIAIDCNVDGLLILKNEMDAFQSVSFHYFTADVSIKENVIQCSEFVLSHVANKPIILINNAGAALISGYWKDTYDADVEWLMNTNFWSMYYLTRLLMPYMLKQNQGHVVMLSSVFGLMGVRAQLAYVTSKFAVRGFCESVREELYTTNIGVTCVHPGGIKTNICVNAKVSGKHISRSKGEIINDLFLLQTRTSADDAAIQIMKAVQQNKKRLLIGVDAKLIDILVRLFPVKHSAILRSLARIFQKNVLDKIEQVYS